MTGLEVTSVKVLFKEPLAGSGAVNSLNKELTPNIKPWVGIHRAIERLELVARVPLPLVDIGSPLERFFATWLRYDSSTKGLMLA